MLFGYSTSYLVAAGIQALAIPFAFLARREDAPSDVIRDNDKDATAVPDPGVGP